MMEGLGSVERVKKLRIEPVNAGLVRFFASLEDIHAAPAGPELIHSLSIEGTISLPELEILSIEPKANYQPFAQCSATVEPVRRLVGTRINAGFREAVLTAMGRTRGCTHFLALAMDVAASHTLTLFLRMRGSVPFEGRGQPEGAWIGTGLGFEPRLENACMGLRSESPVIVNAKAFRETSGKTD
ncbi:MAG: hypothetical protein CFE31_16375 [Rhizobiales bacterium PAR1]|nr:MAG: hypothetical protein CFE31_16375 [Rhizobiales bacterium PAR1]